MQYRFKPRQTSPTARPDRTSQSGRRPWRLSRRRLASFLASAAVLAFLLSACGGSSSSASKSSSSTKAASSAAAPSTSAAPSSGCHGHISHLTVAGVGITTDGIIPFGTAKGFFAAHCVSVSRTTVASPAAALADLIGGSVDIAYSPSIPIVNFLSKGAPLRVLAPADGEPTPAQLATPQYKTYQDLTGIFVPKGSKLKSPVSLEGQTVPVPALKAQLQVVASWALKKAGADPSKVNWVVLDFPTALAELNAGKVAAAGLTYPFSASAVAHGARLLLGDDVPFFGASSAVGMWVTTASRWATDAKALAGFRAAVIQTNAYANTHFSQFAPYASQVTSISTATIAKSSYDIYFPTTVTTQDLARVASNMVYAGFLPRAPSLSGVVLP
ncbi:MAG TPA: ABC transporter substrate-binding protein [Solirubrobacteraceae bacterium]|nr:ABC transporter substrate-binding protein [Solirubrobacteraceae bacterium]